MSIIDRFEAVAKKIDSARNSQVKAEARSAQQVLIRDASDEELELLALHQLSKGSREGYSLTFEHYLESLKKDRELFKKM